jgi:hypothetical protein
MHSELACLTLIFIAEQPTKLPVVTRRYTAATYEPLILSGDRQFEYISTRPGRNQR